MRSDCVGLLGRNVCSVIYGFTSETKHIMLQNEVASN